ncbi:MAG TPA: ABC transporter substrate-binding protein [Miltoncostaeaceae bacterium]|nr:ABC transporter substrate-binding protein [Miltoncostaeaceae bacterium]
MAAAVAVVAGLLLLAACGGGGGGAAAGLPAGDWAAVERRAEGQTVRWWMYGGDARINAYVRDHVVPAAARRGVRLEVVRVDDTADVMQRLLAEREAGRDRGGAVDLVWVNGENFALGAREGLWLPGWAGRLPNARHLDPDDATLTRDFGVPTEGRESPWSRAAFVFAADSARVPRPPRTLRELLGYARDNPGRVTYPAPPDFTGSAFVRLVVQEMGEEEGMRALREVHGRLYRGGEALPKSEAELNRLFGDGQVDIAMSYDPAFVLSGVRTGVFARTARPFALRRTLVNTSFVAIPANAAQPAAAAVVADLLLSPRLQALKADPDVLGVPTVLDPARVPPRWRTALGADAAGPHLLAPDALGAPLAELPADEVDRLEQRWRREVLR